MPETVAELSQKIEVREALAQTGGKPKVKAQATDKFWFITHALVLLGCAAVAFLLGWKLIPLPQAQLDLLQRRRRNRRLFSGRRSRLDRRDRPLRRPTARSRLGEDTAHPKTPRRA